MPNTQTGTVCDPGEKNAAYAVWAQLPGSRPVARAQGGFDGAGATAAAKAGWAGVLCGEQASGSQEEEDRKRRGDSCAALADAVELRLGNGYTTPLTLAHWRTLGMLVGCGSLPRLERLGVVGDYARAWTRAWTRRASRERRDDGALRWPGRLTPHLSRRLRAVRLPRVVASN